MDGQTVKQMSGWVGGLMDQQMDGCLTDSDRQGEDVSGCNML